MAEFEVGLPKRSTSSTSFEIETIVFAGPQAKAPAIAPSVVPTAGTIVVRSISDTLTPGDN